MRKGSRRGPNLVADAAPAETLACIAKQSEDLVECVWVKLAGGRNRGPLGTLQSTCDTSDTERRRLALRRGRVRHDLKRSEHSGERLRERHRRVGGVPATPDLPVVKDQSEPRQAL